MDDVDIRQAGGPAFPVSLPGIGDNGWQGMTLRDWFAGQALPQVLAMDTRGSDLTPFDLARVAYEVADAMLAEREKGRKP